MQNNKIELNDVLIFKKNHPCGGNSWKVLRVGVDFKLECLNCKRVIMLDRLEVYKRMKQRVPHEEN